MYSLKVSYVLKVTTWSNIESPSDSNILGDFGFTKKLFNFISLRHRSYALLKYANYISSSTIVQNTADYEAFDQI